MTPAATSFEEPRRIRTPKLSRLYLGAALGAARNTISSSGNLRVLPQAPVLASHPGITLEQVEQYRALFGGEVFDGVHRRSLPSVLVHIAAFPVQMALMSQDDFPLQLMGMVHLSNQVEHHQPIGAEEALQILARAENLRAHRRGTQVDIVVEIFSADVDVTADGGTQPLWSSVSTYLNRGTYLAGKPDRNDEQGPAFVPPTKTASWKLGTDAGRAYAAVSGDYNPIHVSSLGAKALGMPSAIVHGMYSAGRMLEGREPEQAGHRWSIHFEAPVTLPATVAFAAEEVDDHTIRFTGWNPRKVRRHFTGELII